MWNLPLHPAVVHFPLVLVALAPVAAIVILIGWRRGRLNRKVWWIASGMWGLVALSSFLAVQTGEEDEEIVESVVAEEVIETHEDRAKAFALSTYAVFALSVLVMVGRTDRVRQIAGSVTLVAGLLSSGLAVGVGHSGGSLVYEHGAAAAHIGTDPLIGSEGSVRDGHEGDEGEDDDAEHGRRG